MSDKRIAVIGGSNTIIGGNTAYPQVLKSMGLDVTNFGIGSTTSLYGLMQILRHDIVITYKFILC